MRRLRKSSNIINLVSENNLSSNDLIQPVFIKEDLKTSEEIDSMPGIKRFSIDSAMHEIEEIINSGVSTIALFPVIDPKKKNYKADEALNKSNFISKGIHEIKKRFNEIILIADVALDPYTDHGHDGIIINDEVANDETIDLLVEQSLILAEAGADIIAPSDMMDGRIGVIRNVFEESGFKDKILLSYAAKYNSNFYGPFRDAVNSSSSLGNSSKFSYQMSPANINEGLHEVALDIEEGADIVMIKPAMPYLDVISKVKETFKVPTFAYQVSGEFCMLKLAINKGWLDKKVMLESLLSIKRAGADAILSYAAKEISLEIKNK